jgi:hypothetical protein
MRRALRGLLALTASLSILPSLILGVNDPSKDPPTLTAGSALHVRLTTTLTSKTNKAGDPFTGQVIEPVMVNGVEVVPKGSLIDGHVSYLKPAGRVTTKAAMRIVIDDIVTPDDIKYQLTGDLQEAKGVPCANVGSDSEGTIKGCGKSKKQAAKDAAIAGGIGAAGGLMVGLASRGGCSYYYGCWPGSGPGVGTDVLAGASVGAGTALIYNLLKKHKDIILVDGTHLTFVIDRTVKGVKSPASDDASSESQDEPSAESNSSPKP